MAYFQGFNRQQICMFQTSYDEIIAEDNQVRLVDKFVSNLNAKEIGFTNSDPKHEGQVSYNPLDMCKLYIYGYLDGIRSSRRLQRECGRNQEVIWLLGGLKPDFRTIADFRKDNTKALKKVFKEFVRFCMKLGLVKGEIIAIDGTKVKAMNSKSKNYTISTLKAQIKQIDKYLDKMNELDENEKPIEEYTEKEINEKINKLENRKAELQGNLKELEKNKETQKSLTDPDSRRMKLSKGGFDICYNVQSAVDGENDIIVDFEVTNDGNDMNQLENMSEKAEEVIKEDKEDKNKDEVKITVLADKGYRNPKDILECLQRGIIPNVYPPDGQNYYEFIIPFQKLHKNIKKHCIIIMNGRNMKLRFYPDLELLKKRKQIVEHPFGTVKFWNHSSYFLTIGKTKTTAEMALSFLAYNVKRVVNILGVENAISMM